MDSSFDDDVPQNPPLPDPGQWDGAHEHQAEEFEAQQVGETAALEGDDHEAVEGEDEDEQDEDEPQAD